MFYNLHFHTQLNNCQFPLSIPFLSFIRHCSVLFSSVLFCFVLLGLSSIVVYNCHILLYEYILAICKCKYECLAVWLGPEWNAWLSYLLVWLVGCNHIVCLDGFFVLIIFIADAMILPFLLCYCFIHNSMQLFLIFFLRFFRIFR